MDRGDPYPAEVESSCVFFFFNAMFSVQSSLGGCHCQLGDERAGLVKPLQAGVAGD